MKELLEAVLGALSADAAEDIVAVQAQVEERQRTETDPEVLGALESLLGLLRLRAQSSLEEGDAETMSNETLMRVLSHLEPGPLTKKELAARVHPHATPASGASMITRQTKGLEEAGYIRWVQDGTFHRVSLEPKGHKLVEIWRSRTEAPPTPLERQIRLSLKADFQARRWATEAGAGDRTRFHLVIAGLHVVDELFRKPRWRQEDVALATLLKTFPFSNDDQEFDKQVLEEHKAALLPVHQDLMTALFGYQVDTNRVDSAELFVHVGRKLGGDPLALLWAPCAVNIACRLGWQHPADPLPRQAEQLLDLVMVLLSSRKESVARDQVAKAALLRRDYDTTSRAWRSLLALKEQGDRRQLVVGARLNIEQFLDFADALEVTQRWLSEDASDLGLVKEVLGDTGGDPSMATQFVNWSIANTERLTEVFSARLSRERPGSLAALAIPVWNTASAKHENLEEGGMAEMLELSRMQSHWVLTQLGRRPGELGDIKRHRADRKFYENALVNNIWRPESVWLDLVSATAYGRGVVRTGTA